MAPKKSIVVQGETTWRSNIEEAILNDDTWQVKVIMIEAAGSKHERIYLNKFEIYAAEERRFVIKNICKTETIFMVNQLGGDKKIKDDNLRVFEEGQAFLKEKKNIPSDLLALIIKHLILKMKHECLFIKKQRLETKEGFKAESLIMVHKDEVRGTVSKPAESKGKKESSSAFDETRSVDGKKYNTSLRVRGEEWRDKIYVDDYPTDGPNLYVAITGFIDEELPMCLLKIGIPLTAVVQLRIDPDLVRVPSSLFQMTKRGQSQTDVITDKSHNFWKELQDLRVKTLTTDIFKNTAFIIFSPPYCKDQELVGSPDVIYDELCYLMYDIQDLTRQHLHYIDNMKVIKIPTEEESHEKNSNYHVQLENIPLECVSIYSILDSMLLTVCKHLETRPDSLNSINTTSPSSSQDEENIKIKLAQKIVKDIFNTLCKDETCKQYRVTYGKEYEKHKDPVIIKNGDIAKYKNFGLKNANLDRIIWSTLRCMPINKLWCNTLSPSEEVEAKLSFHFNLLLSSFEREDVETSEIIRLIHLLACRKLYNNRSSLKKIHLPNKTVSEFKKNFLKRSKIAEPLRKCPSVNKSCSSAMHDASVPNISKEILSSIDYSSENVSETDRIKLLFDCPDLTELASAAEIANQKPFNHMIDDYEYFEDFTGTCAFQMILEAFNDYNCVDCKYCEVTDCYVLMFYNSHDKEGVSRDEWRCHITTPVSLQDFFDFVIDEHYDWIQQEENLYDETIKLGNASALKNSLTLVNKCCIENTDIEAELLLEGSLKYQEIEKDKEPPPASTTSMADSPSSKQTNTTISNTKSSKRTKSTQKVSPTKTPKYLFKEKEPSEESVEQIDLKPFLGYNLGDRRIEIFGKDCSFFSRDGSKVTTNYTLLIPTNQEYISLSFVPGITKHEFKLHKTLSDEEQSPQVKEICDSVRVTCEDQMIINLKKQTYSKEQSIETNPHLGSEKDLNQGHSTSKPALNQGNATSKAALNQGNVTSKAALNQGYATSKALLNPIEEVKNFYSFSIGWPNGLITESVYDTNSSELSHIKQYHTNPLAHLQEDMRCISLNGEVIIFKNDGNIEVLRPEGTFTLITKCEKYIKINPEAQELHNDIHDKKKLDRGKHKGNQKVKNILVEEEGSHAKEYELEIKEFEIIDTLGFKKRWVDNVEFELEKLLIRTATDFTNGEIFSKRSDGTFILLNKDGIQVVTYPNGTRIITYFVIEENEIFTEWTDDEIQFLELFDPDIGEASVYRSKTSISQKSINTVDSFCSASMKKSDIENSPLDKRNDGFISVQIIYTIEHENFTTVSINKANGKIIVDSPNNTSLIVDSKNHYHMILDNNTTALFDGDILDITYVSCTDCHVHTRCKINTSGNDDIKQTWLTMTDSFSKYISVTYEGIFSTEQDDQFRGSTELMKEDLCVENNEDVEPLDIYTNETHNTMEQGSQEKIEVSKSESSIGTRGKCVDEALIYSPRFFILHRDLTCSEVVHKALVDQYRTACQSEPWCSFNEYDTYGDHRKLYSILSPINLTETEKWLANSKLANKPKHLVYKDLKEDSGKGFYHWMRPYERFVPETRKPPTILPPRQPKAFILRTLEKQWSDNEREELKGARELIMAILKYRKALETDCATLLTIPIRDIRSNEDREADDILQALGHRIYEDLKSRLDEDVLNRAQAGITTEPPVPSSDTSLGEEMAEDEFEAEVGIEDEAEYLKEIEEVEKLSPNLAKYWQRRVESCKEEDFYKYLLRAGTVPPYFKNLLGGAIWWEVNNIVTNAATKAERKKTTCGCSAEAGDEESTVQEDSFM